MVPPPSPIINYNVIKNIAETGYTRGMSEDEKINLYTDNFLEYLYYHRDMFDPFYNKLTEILNESFGHIKDNYPNSEIQRYTDLDNYLDDPSPPRNFYIDKEIENTMFALADANRMIELAEENRRLLGGKKKKKSIKKKSTKKKRSIKKKTARKKTRSNH